jgi:hypothetical protein
MTANGHKGRSGEEVFMEHLRNVPFTEEDRDLLISAERWINGGFAFLPVGSFQAVFRGVGEKEASKVMEAGYCLARAAALLHWCEMPARSALDRNMARGAMHLYMTEAQRLFGLLFPEGHVFWKCFYTRVSAHIHDHQEPEQRQVKRRYAIIFLVVDAWQALSKEKHQLEYELLLQSLGAVITAVFGTTDAHDRNIHLHQALRLANRIGLQEYDAWITDLFHQQKNTLS